MILTEVLFSLIPIKYNARNNSMVKLLFKNFLSRKSLSQKFQIKIFSYCTKHSAQSFRRLLEKEQYVLQLLQQMYLESLQRITEKETKTFGIMTEGCLSFVRKPRGVKKWLINLYFCRYRRIDSTDEPTLITASFILSLFI